MSLRLSTGTTFWLTNRLVSEFDAFSYSGKWLAGDFDGNGRDDLAYIFNDGGMASITTFLSLDVAGSTVFQEAGTVRRTGGWSDDIQWLVGYFNNDDNADIAAVWRNGNSTALAVRTSSYSLGQINFTLHNSAVNMGGWSDDYKWLSGDFNGDGLTDLACAWNEGGYEQVSVYPSTGSASNNFFTTWSAWDHASFRYTWASDTKWVVGDFNEDGKADVASVWHNLYYGADTIAITVRLANPVGNAPGVRGTSFAAPQVWAYPAGGWMSRTQFCGGKFTP